MPRVVLLAGINGAGKTSASRELLVDVLKIPVFTNADTLARGLNSLNPEAEAFRAGRVLLDWVHDLARQKRDFALETTLSARTYAGWLGELRQTGYEVYLFYYWLASVDLAVARVAQRVLAGGHHIPEADIRRRYGRSVRNFLELYRDVADEWEVYDNTNGKRVLIGMGSRGNEVHENDEFWKAFVGSGHDAER